MDNARPGWIAVRLPVQLHAALVKIGADAQASDTHPLKQHENERTSELAIHKVIAYLVRHLHNDRRRGRESSKRRSTKRAAQRGLLACGLSPRQENE